MAKRKVNLWMLSHNKYGGWCTFTRHLSEALRRQGIDSSIYKVTAKGQRGIKDFGWGLKYQNRASPEIIELGENPECEVYREVKKYPNLILAVQKNFYPEAMCLMLQGAWIVIHDPTELRNPEFAGFVKRRQKQVIVIRKTMLEHLPKAEFIGHPYERYFKGWDMDDGVWNTNHAVSVARVDFDKNLDWMLDANRELPEDKQIIIRGFDNRIYTRFHIMDKYPEWKQSTTHFPRDVGWAEEFCYKARYMVDLSAIKGDGGGTQYTFLEAIDGGAICVLNTDWIREGGEMRPGINCYAVSDAKGLRVLLDSIRPYDDSVIRQQALAILEAHSLENIGDQYFWMLIHSIRPSASPAWKAFRKLLTMEFWKRTLSKS